jgi:hypothetical protein
VQEIICAQQGCKLREFPIQQAPGFTGAAGANR